jgi:hypothetical protein
MSTVKNCRSGCAETFLAESFQLRWRKTPEIEEIQVINSGTGPPPIIVVVPPESVVGFTVDVERVRHAWDSGNAILSAVSIRDRLTRLLHRR